jgi:HK97 family phage major capsid protein
VFYNTAEAGVKTAAKLSFSKNEVSLQKYAVIVPATDELTEDAAVDYWNLVTRELSRGYARKADEVVFTDATTGITNLSGVITQPVSGAGTTIKWEDLLAAEGKTEDDLDESNNKWFMRKETWFRLIQKRADAVTAADGAGLFLAGSLADGWVPNPKMPTTPWGREVVYTRVLPTSGGTTTSGTYGSSVVSSNDGFAVYGDLKNYILYNKNGMALKMLTEATIVDQAGTTTNLATQDISAMRAVIRLLGICAKGNRGKFVIVGTGTVS